MSAKQEKTELVIIDPGSAHVVSGLVAQEVSCGQQLDGPITNSLPAARFQAMVMCKELARQSGDDSNEVDVQCVVMSGDVKKCPLLVGGDSAVLTSKLQELQKKVASSLTYSPVGNFSTVHGSDLDPTHGGLGELSA